MRLSLLLAALVPFLGLADGIGELVKDFTEPPQAVRPWTYWFWINTLTDRETVTEELEDIARLGFGGLMLTDSRGYWDDEDHVVNPPATMRWGGDEWIELVAHAVKECEKLGLTFSLNVGASGGLLRGDVDVGADTPKFLMFRRYRPGDVLEVPDVLHFREVALFAVRTEKPLARTDWQNAGDGYYSMSESAGRREDGGDELCRTQALEVRELASVADCAKLGSEWTVIRFGSGGVRGREKEIDVLDRMAVRRHLDRVIGRLLNRVPGLFGRDRTFCNLYNVSWEGAMPTWSATFEQDFQRIAGYPLRPLLLMLAGFDIAEKERESFMRDFRRARGVMMCEHLYGEVRRWAHERQMGAFSESGGPWVRTPQVFGECDQIGFLGANDFPQGEFWPLSGNGLSAAGGHANVNGRYLVKGVVSAAHAYGAPVASVEAFTHMHRHWSVDPAFLKPLGDQAFADGINRFLWHTYTASPKRFGVPGLEYFAGSHINRNVTWHDAFPAMVKYLARCQCLLQRGEPVTDIAVLVGDRAYAHWGTQENGRFRNRVSDEMPLDVPCGFCYDALNDDALARNPRLVERYAVVHDARSPGADRGCVDVGALVPDVETSASFTWCHRRDGQADIYFLAGEGPAECTFRAAAPAVEVWDAVSGRRTVAAATPIADGRTKVMLDLPVGGSAFVMFLPEGSGAGRPPVDDGWCLPIKSPWRVSFAYPQGIATPPPKPVMLSALVDFTNRQDLCHFAGTATYRTMFDVPTDVVDGMISLRLSLGRVPSGLVSVLVNGKDCGTVWCAPWEADITSAVRAGDNELELAYVNNWQNRLIGDCALPAERRVTRSVLRYWNVPRLPDSARPNVTKPTVYSGYSSFDALQSSGLLGPISLVVAADPLDRAVLHGKMEKRHAGVQDAMRTAELRNVRLGGVAGKKLNALIAARITSPFAQREIFGEARRAFEERDDDLKPGGGLWRGEFWGKLMLGTARVADYLRNPQLTAFVREECHRMIALQDTDGYLGSYRNKDRVAIMDEKLTCANYGWPCLWNLWNRKYAMWGMLMAYKVTGDQEIIASVEHQMSQLVDMMHSLGFRLQETGATQMNGLPSMSLLKPLVMLYEETGNRKSLDYAAEMLPDWDRTDAPPPNFFRNAFSGKPLADWYEKPQVWAKAYEMMSCMDGLLEYYRVTGERRCLDTVVAIRDGLVKDESNPFQAVGYGDKFFYAAQRANALNEVCDVIHWIRLNLDLYLITGNKRFLDAIEPAYVNGFLAGIYRDGQWGPFFLRGHGRHQFQRQCGYAYNHCCVNNLPRTFMDIASAVVTADAKGTYHVNFYEDATVEMDGVRFEISGNYPIGDTVTVTTSKKVPLAFHRPSWCPKMSVCEEGLRTTVRFDMNPRIIDRVLPNRADDVPRDGLWAFNRYGDKQWKGYNKDILDSYRTTAAAQVMWGPIVLAKARRIGDTDAEIFTPLSVNGKGYSLKLTSLKPTSTWGLWELELTKSGKPTVKVKVCDFQSAGDTPIDDKGMEFSIWF